MTALFSRAAPIAGTADDATRTIEIAFATSTPVKRYSYEEGYYLEVLEISDASIDRTRLEAGMSLLDTHDSGSMDSRLGSVVPGTFRIAGGKALCRVKLSRSEPAERVWQDILDGHVTPISVGYRIDESKKTEGQSNGLPTITATRWTPLEVSLVPIPADPSAHTRKDTDVPEPLENNEPIRQEQPTAYAIRQERKRVSEIRFIARSAGLDDEQVDAAIENGTSLNSFRNAAFEHMAAKQAKSPTFPHVSTVGVDGNSRQDEELKARTDALVSRMTGRPAEGAAREFQTSSLMDHARGLLEARGISTRTLSREQILGYRARSYGQHTTSDFPQLLQGAGERVLQQAYEAVQSPLKTILSRRSTATDFRAKSKLKISDAGLLERVNESGEIKATTRSEAAESYRLESYARIFSLSFQAIVNDDLGAFTDWSIQAGRMAAATENKILLELLTDGSGAGPIMSEDHVRLFHATHKNLAAAGTVLDETNLGAGILAFRKQTSLGGQRIAIAPRYLLVGPELELTAQKLVASISPAKTADAVPEAIKSLVPIVEPNLDGKSWYLFADPAAGPVFEWAHLAGHEGPQIDTRDGFERLGTEFRAVLHFGAGATDFRGAYRNPGV
jgi:phage head maturation protease